MAMSKLAPYQQEAMRSVAAGFSRHRASVVVANQVQSVLPENRVFIPAGYCAELAATAYPFCPYIDFQDPWVAASAVT